MAEPPIGQLTRRLNITNITNSDPCLVTVDGDLDESGFYDRAFVRFTELNGSMPMPHGEDQLNNGKYRIIILSADTFKIQDPITFRDIDSTTFPPYVTGGSCNLVQPTFIYYPPADQPYPN